MLHMLLEETRRHMPGNNLHKDVNVRDSIKYPGSMAILALWGGLIVHFCDLRTYFRAPCRLTCTLLISLGAERARAIGIASVCVSVCGAQLRAQGGVSVDVRICQKYRCKKRAAKSGLRHKSYATIKIIEIRDPNTQDC